MKQIPLKLKSFGCYETTAKGIFFYMEHDFKTFVPNEIIEKIITIYKRGYNNIGYTEREKNEN